jgi:uncharacterized protein YjlB
MRLIATARVKSVALGVHQQGRLAYTGRAEYDIRRGDPNEHGAVMRNIAAVELPACDPVSGRDGPLRKLWAEVARCSTSQQS